MAVEPVANQRVIRVNKALTDKQNIYTKNNLSALDEAARRLQSKGGFKLYMYMAKNQDKYEFALSSAFFCEWSGLGRTAYTTAFEELIKEGYLIPYDKSKQKETRFLFYEKSQLPEEDCEQPIIVNEKENVQKIQQFKRFIDEDYGELSPAVVFW